MSAFSTISRRVSRYSLRIRLGRGTGRTILLVLFCIALGWLLYTTVYVPLQQNASLPTGISSQDPALNEKELQDLIKTKNEAASTNRDMLTNPQQQFFRAPVASPTPHP